jgi:hypothetical protein
MNMYFDYARTSGDVPCCDIKSEVKPHISIAFFCPLLSFPVRDRLVLGLHTAKYQDICSRLRGPKNLVNI